MKGTKLIDRTLELATILTFFGIIVVVTIQILSRYLPYTAIWTEELTRFLFIYSVSFAAPLALKRKEFISIELVEKLLPRKAKVIYEAFIYLAVAIFCAVVVYQGYQFALIGIGQKSATMTIDMSVIHASIGIAVLFISIYALLHIVELMKSLRKGD
jgi:TRAP-type transport system small permease protein